MNRRSRKRQAVVRVDKDMKILEASNIRKEFGTLVAVNDISLSLEKGQVMGLIGPNEAGKTTLLRILGTLLRPTSGLFFIWGIISAFLAVISKAVPSLYVFYLVIIFSFYLFLLLLLEIYVVYNPVLNKIAILLVFLTILYLILPLLLSFTLKISSLRFYSPFGFFVHIINPFSRRDYDIYTSACTCAACTGYAGTGVLIVNLLLCVIPVFLISKRYFYILTLRRKM
jgi:energy-coupling factor transporter ATP-binding protein EcfA2